MAVSAFCRILRSRPVPILLWKNYCQHRVSAHLAFEGDVVPVGIAQNPIAVLIYTTEVCDSCHFRPSPDYTRRLAPLTFATGTQFSLDYPLLISGAETKVAVESMHYP